MRRTAVLLVATLAAVGPAIAGQKASPQRATADVARSSRLTISVAFPESDGPAYYVAKTRRPVFEGYAPSSAVRIEVFANDRLIASGESDGSTWLAQSDELPPGRHRVYAVAIDANGERSKPSNRPYLVIPDLDVRTLDDMAASAGIFLTDGSIDNFGVSSIVPLGDVNADGVEDLALLAPGADYDRAEDAGVVYVVFGRADFALSPPDLATLDGADGFRIVGSAVDHRPIAVAALGDVDGDGIDDFAIGSSYVGFATRRVRARVTVMLGRSGPFEPVRRLSRLKPPDAVRIDAGSGSGFVGEPLAGGADVNGDGLMDILIGAANRQPCGGAYVVYGRPKPLLPVMALSEITAETGLSLGCTKNAASVGSAIAAAGDLNGDGLDDIAVGGTRAGPTGSAFVVYGRQSGREGTLDLMSMAPEDGFRVTGSPWPIDGFGATLAGGEDIDGDGHDDLAIGSWSNLVAVIRGRDGAFPAKVSAQTMSADLGFLIWSQGVDYSSIASLQFLPDQNGDGRQELVVAVPEYRPQDAASSFVVFSRDRRFRKMEPVEALAPGQGYRIDAPGGTFYEGIELTAADLNADGLSDLVFSYWKPGKKAGKQGTPGAYVILGREAARGTR